MTLGRPFVYDDTPTAEVWDYDYRGALLQLDAGGVILDWDIALGKEQRERLDAIVAESPELVHVVPYRLYPESTGLDQTVWSPRLSDGHGGWRWATEEDQTCNLFGFGCTYIPGWLASAATAEIDGGISDWSISEYHYRTSGARIPIHWEIDPVHIHY